MAKKKGTGNWKPLPADPGPQKIVGTVEPMMPVDPEVRVREKAKIQPVSKTNPGIEEIGGGKSKK